MKRQNSKTAGGPQKKAKKGDGESTQKTVKKERKKTAQYAEKLVKDMNVACTGARCGEVIQGYRCTAAGAVAKGKHFYERLMMYSITLSRRHHPSSHERTRLSQGVS